MGASAAIVAALVVFQSAPAHTGGAPAVACTCASALRDGGWCEAHGVGYVAAVAIPSRPLYDALDAHGHALDLGTFTCEGCKKAIASDGFCDEHRIGFVGKQAYFSRLTYELARGKAKDPGAIGCATCRKNAESHGWCPTCRIGMIGRVAMVDEQAYRLAAEAVAILQEAVGTLPRCESCALAMVTDTRCPRCKITYRSGRPVAPAP